IKPETRRWIPHHRFLDLVIRHSFVIWHSSFVIPSLVMSHDLASVVVQRINSLGRISDDPARLTRTFCSPAMRRANDLVGSWMREAGMAVREDAIGNLIGRYGENPESKVRSPESGVQSLKFSEKANGKTLLLGSHLDTVRDAGKF